MRENELAPSMHRSKREADRQIGRQTNIVHEAQNAKTRFFSFIYSFILALWIRNSVSPTTTKYKSHSSCRFILESFDKFRTVWMRTHSIMLRDATHENLSSSLPPPLLRLAAVWYGPAVGLGYANSFYFSDRIFSILSTLFPPLSWTKQKSFLFFLCLHGHR